VECATGFVCPGHEGEDGRIGVDFGLGGIGSVRRIAIVGSGSGSGFGSFSTYTGGILGLSLWGVSAGLGRVSKGFCLDGLDRSKAPRTTHLAAPWTCLVSTCLAPMSAQALAVRAAVPTG
jgi:hypothetical protein